MVKALEKEAAELELDSSLGDQAYCLVRWGS